MITGERRRVRRLLPPHRGRESGRRVALPAGAVAAFAAVTASGPVQLAER